MGQIVVEPSFRNLQATEEGRPLAPTGELLVAAQRGMIDVGHLDLPPSGVASSMVDRLLEALPSNCRGRL